jgi:phage portal protein BeeE
MRLGLSPLKRLVLEVSSDQEATRFSDALLGNYGVPGLVVTTRPMSRWMRRRPWRSRRTSASLWEQEPRQRRGVTNGATGEQFGFDPQQMNLESVHRLPEERISAVLRVPAIIAGLGAGLSRATYANFREARAMFTEQCILPLYRFDQRVINQQLRPDFTSDRRIYAAFDTTDVRALQEDEDSKYARLDAAVKTGWIEADEARADVGLPPRGFSIAPAPALPAAAKSLDVLAEIKAGGGFERYPELMAAMVELAQPGFEAELDEFFDSQRKRIKRKIIGAG